MVRIHESSERVNLFFYKALPLAVRTADCFFFFFFFFKHKYFSERLFKLPIIPRRSFHPPHPHPHPPTPLPTHSYISTFNYHDRVCVCRRLSCYHPHATGNYLTVLHTFFLHLMNNSVPVANKICLINFFVTIPSKNRGS